MSLNRRPPRCNLVEAGQVLRRCWYASGMLATQPKLAVLLLMDLQEGICRAEGPVGRHGIAAEVVRRQVLEKAGSTAEDFRRAGNNVVHVRLALGDEFERMTSSSPRFQEFRQHGLFRDGDPMTAICPEVAPKSGEPVISKGGVNPFIGTNLQCVLVRLAATEVVLGGVSTNHVVEATARHAADAGYLVTVLEDLCASSSDAMHRFAVDEILPHYGAVTTSDEWLSARHHARRR